MLTLHQKDVHLNTNMIEQLYIKTQLFIHHNLVQHNSLFALYVATLHYYTSWQHCHLIRETFYAWYAKMGGEHLYLLDFMAHMVLSFVHRLHNSL